MNTAEFSKLIKIWSSLRKLKMPEDKETISYLIKAAPEGVQSHLKFFGARRAYRRSGILYPLSITVDTTLACNFACPSCYIASDLFAPSKENIEKGSSVEEWERRFEHLHAENPFILHASWVGGEPTLRRDLLKRGVQHFLNNWIHTNGYIPLAADLGDKCHKVIYMVSIDGYREAHDKMRPTRGGNQATYERVLSNIQRSQGLNIMVHTVVSPDNAGTLRKLIEDLRATGKVGSIVVSVLSPQKGSQVFTPKERDAIVDKLLRYRREYRSFIWSTPTILKSMRSARINDTYGDGCRIKVRDNGTGGNIPLDVHGAVKKQCVMGPEQSCDECGCAIPAQYASLLDNTLRGELENTPVIGRLLDYTIRN